MPELPDIVAYLDALNSRVVQKRLRRVKLFNPFVLRSVDPPLDAVQDQEIADIRRIGKRIVLGFSAASSTGDPALFLVIHLMIAGRLRWREPDIKLGFGPKIVLATFEFEHGTLYFTEAGSKKRASITLVRGEPALRALDPGGLEPLEVTIDQFRDALTREQHTLKRSLTDPHLFSGIGNAYSDEILHAAQLSPLKLTRSLSDEEARRLFDATRKTLELWIDRFRAEARGGFPEKVTAFREGMAVHGRFRQPCPRCGSPVQRIVYADNECNYCARCQTGGRLLADRSLSRLLRDDWPKWLKE
jgi:formamidopyrimidine-DNA glycosylase